MTGIHEHPTLKLGLLPTAKDQDELLHVGWRAGKVPSYPTQVERLSLITIGLDRNDELGDCGPTSVDNHRRITTRVLAGHEADASIGDVLDLYSRATQPPFDPATGANDNGVDMATLMAAARSGGLAGTKIVAFAKLKDISDASIFAAISLFGAVLFAVDLQQAQQDQSDAASPTWDYSRSADWGGHAVCAGSYNSATGTVDVASWGMRIGTTRAFRAHQLAEVWVPLWPEILQSRHFAESVEYDELAADFQALTGSAFPAPPVTPTPPAPSPAPTPDPGAASFLAAADAAYPGLAARLAARGAKHKPVMDAEGYALWLLAGEVGLR